LTWFTGIDGGLFHETLQLPSAKSTQTTFDRWQQFDAQVAEVHRRGLRLAKRVGGLGKTKLLGVKKVAAQTVSTLSAYKLSRMGSLWPTAWAVVGLKSAQRRF
jgi:hypothetical protein